MPNLQLPKHKEAKKALVKLKEKLNEKIKNDSGGDLKEYEMEMDEFMKANPLTYKKHQKLTEEDDKQLKIINTDRKVYWKDIPTTFAKRNATEYNDIISVAQKGRVRTDDERNQDSLNNPPKSKKSTESRAMVATSKEDISRVMKKANKQRTEAEVKKLVDTDKKNLEEEQRKEVEVEEREGLDIRDVDESGNTLEADEGRQAKEDPPVDTTKADETKADETVVEEEPVVEEETVVEEEQVIEPVSNKPMMNNDNDQIQNTIEGNNIEMISSQEIPSSRMSVDNKDIKQLINDINYFFKTYPTQLKNLNKFKNSLSSMNLEQLIRLHKRITSIIQPNKNEGKKIGVVIDAEEYITRKINELLVDKAVSSFQLPNLQPIGELETNKDPNKKDIGSYEIKRSQNGLLNSQKEPVYRYIPTTQPEQVDEFSYNFNTRNKRISLPKPKMRNLTQTAKREVKNNPFNAIQKGHRLNVIQ